MGRPRASTSGGVLLSDCGVARITGTSGVGGTGRGLFCEPFRDDRRPLSRKFDLEEFREEDVVAICAIVSFSPHDFCQLHTKLRLLAAPQRFSISLQ